MWVNSRLCRGVLRSTVSDVGVMNRQQNGPFSIQTDPLCSSLAWVLNMQAAPGMTSYRMSVAQSADCSPIVGQRNVVRDKRRRNRYDPIVRPGSGSIHQLWCEHRRLQYKLRRLGRIAALRQKQCDSGLMLLKLRKAALSSRFEKHPVPSVSPFRSGLTGGSDHEWSLATERMQDDYGFRPAPTVAPTEILTCNYNGGYIGDRDINCNVPWHPDHKRVERDRPPKTFYGSGWIHRPFTPKPTPRPWWVPVGHPFGWTYDPFEVPSWRWVDYWPPQPESFELWKESQREAIRRAENRPLVKYPENRLVVRWEDYIVHGKDILKLPSSIRYRYKYLVESCDLWRPDEYLIQAWNKGEYTVEKEEAATLFFMY